MGQHIIQVLILGNGREMVGNSILALSSNELGMFLGIDTTGYIIFHEEGIARLMTGCGTLVHCHDGSDKDDSSDG